MKKNYWIEAIFEKKSKIFSQKLLQSLEIPIYTPFAVGKIVSIYLRLAFHSLSLIVFFSGFYISDNRAKEADECRFFVFVFHHFPKTPFLHQ
jgi:hypothetical protein